MNHRRSEVTVSTRHGPSPNSVGPLAFDVVPDKAVKGAVVSGLKNPIGSSPLQWEVDTGGAAVAIANGGVVGDFRVKETSEGSGKFQLVVMNSGATALSGTLPINVAVTYDPDAAVDDDDVTVNLTGGITERNALAFDPADGAYSFTIPQGISANTPIGAFVVTGDVDGEYLDGMCETAGRSASETRT